MNHCKCSVLLMTNSLFSPFLLLGAVSCLCHSGMIYLGSIKAGKTQLLLISMTGGTVSEVKTALTLSLLDGLSELYLFVLFMKCSWSWFFEDVVDFRGLFLFLNHVSPFSSLWNCLFSLTTFCWFVGCDVIIGFVCVMNCVCQALLFW